jgi:hypothetical protein
MGFYSNRVSKRLAELLKEAGEGGTQKRMDLAEEVDLARVNAVRALNIFDKTCLDPDTCKKEGITDELRIAAQSNLREALSFVADMVTKFGKATQLSEDLLNAVQVEYVVIELTMILKEELGEDNEAMPRVLKRLTELSLPEKQATRNVTIAIT